MLDKIKASLQNAELYEYSEDESASYIKNQIESDGLFSELKLIILNQLPIFPDCSKSTSDKRWGHIFSNLQEDCRVVINNVPKRGNTAIFKVVAKEGKVIEYPDSLKQHEAANWLQQHAEIMKIKINNDIANEIVFYLAEDKSEVLVDDLFICLNKFSMYLGTRTVVKADDVIRVCEKSPFFVIWNLLSAIDNKNYDSCMSWFNKAIKAEKTVDGAVIQIINLLIWKFRLLLFVKESISGGKQEVDIIADAENMHKITRSGSGPYAVYSRNDKGKPFSVGAIKNCTRGNFGNAPAIEKYSRIEIFNILAAVYDCHLRLRWGANNTEKKILLEELFFEICNGKYRDKIQQFRSEYGY
jgi:DNA polymerase III delta subunit